MNDHIPLDADGPAYTSSQERYGVPLDYSDKLATAIEELHRFALNHPQERGELVAPMYYALVAHLGLHNMLAKANDLSCLRSSTLPCRFTP